MQQFESVLFKGRPFPEEDPVMGVPFLLELTTFVLSGTHDIDRMDGPLTIFTPSESCRFWVCAPQARIPTRRTSADAITRVSFSA